MNETTNERLARHDRLTLGTLCRYHHAADEADVPIVVTVIGTWDWNDSMGRVLRFGTMQTPKQAREGQDPRTDESARGYLLMPSDGSPWIYEYFGAAELGDLTPLFPALHLVK